MPASRNVPGPRPGLKSLVRHSIERRSRAQRLGIADPYGEHRFVPQHVAAARQVEKSGGVNAPRLLSVRL